MTHQNWQDVVFLLRHNFDIPVFNSFYEVTNRFIINGSDNTTIKTTLVMAPTAMLITPAGQFSRNSFRIDAIVDQTAIFCGNCGAMHSQR